MSYRHDGTASHEWKKWVQQHSNALTSTGVPSAVYSDRLRWIRFLEEGADYERGFFVQQLNRSEATALYEFVQRQYGDSEYRGLLHELEAMYPEFAKENALQATHKGTRLRTGKINKRTR